MKLTLLLMLTLMWRWREEMNIVANEDCNDEIEGCWFKVGAFFCNKLSLQIECGEAVKGTGKKIKSEMFLLFETKYVTDQTIPHQSQIYIPTSDQWRLRRWLCL